MWNVPICKHKKINVIMICKYIKNTILFKMRASEWKSITNHYIISRVRRHGIEGIKGVLTTVVSIKGSLNHMTPLDFKHNSWYLRVPCCSLFLSKKCLIVKNVFHVCLCVYFVYFLSNNNIKYNFISNVSIIFRVLDVLWSCT